MEECLFVALPLLSAEATGERLDDGDLHREFPHSPRIAEWGGPGDDDDDDDSPGSGGSGGNIDPDDDEGDDDDDDDEDEEPLRVKSSASDATLLAGPASRCAAAIRDSIRSVR